MIVNRSRSFRLIVIVSMLWPGCYRNPASMGTFLSSYHGDILMEFRQFHKSEVAATRGGGYPARP